MRRTEMIDLQIQNELLSSANQALCLTVTTLRRVIEVLVCNKADGPLYPRPLQGKVEIHNHGEEPSSEGRRA